MNEGVWASFNGLVLVLLGIYCSLMAKSRRDKKQQVEHIEEDREPIY